MFSNFLNIFTRAFPGGSVVKDPPANAGDARNMGWNPGSGRSHGEGNGNPLQYTCLENSKNRGAWQATVYEATKNWKRLSTHTKHTYTVSSVSILPPSSPTFAPNTLSTALKSQRIKHFSYLDFISTFFGNLLNLFLFW